MTNPLDDLVAIALGGERCTYYEMLPENFGPPGGRWILLERCLEVLANRYAPLTLELSGSLDALRKFGLAPGRPVMVGDMTVAVVFGQSDRLGAVRLQFSRAAFSARRAAPRQPAEASGD
jgi:hypothetical protein